MKKYYLVAYQEIINHQTGRIHSDDGLIALDGLKCGRVHELSRVNTETMSELIEEFIRDYPGFRFDKCELREFALNH